MPIIRHKIRQKTFTILLKWVKGFSKVFKVPWCGCSTDMRRRMLLHGNLAFVFLFHHLKGEVPAYSSKLKFAVLNSLSFNACHGQQGHIFWHSGTFSGMHILKTAVSTAILAAATLEHCGSTYEKQLPGREALLTNPHCDEVWNSSVFSLRGSQDILFFFWTSILEMAITIYTQRPTFFRKHHLQQF